jgi:hypothetical protein
LSLLTGAVVFGGGGGEKREMVEVEDKVRNIWCRQITLKINVPHSSYG